MAAAPWRSARRLSAPQLSATHAPSTDMHHVLCKTLILHLGTGIGPWLNLVQLQRILDLNGSHREERLSVRFAFWWAVSSPSRQPGMKPTYSRVTGEMKRSWVLVALTFEFQPPLKLNVHRLTVSLTTKLALLVTPTCQTMQHFKKFVLAFTGLVFTFSLENVCNSSSPRTHVSLNNMIQYSLGWHSYSNIYLKNSNSDTGETEKGSWLDYFPLNKNMLIKCPSHFFLLWNYCLFVWF